MNSENEIKMIIELEDREMSESMWVIPRDIGYEVLNVPYFAFGLSFGDIVLCKIIDDQLYFEKKLKDSGHSTYRIFCNNDQDDSFEFYFDLLIKSGCTYEKASENFYAIDVSPAKDIYEIYKILELGEKREAWEFEEGYCGHPAVTGFSS